MATTPLLQVSALCCRRHQTTLFSNLSFSLAAGDMLALQGANGSGKSSLLRLLTGITSATAGEIFWHSKSISISSSYTESLHYIGHMPGIKLGLTVEENLQLFCQLAQMPLQNIKETLALLQLEEKQHTVTYQLSAGQKRRVALAKLFLIKKALWILDEPLTALDQSIQKVFFEKLDNHLKEGGIAVISTHQPLTMTRAIQTLVLPIC